MSATIANPACNRIPAMRFSTKKRDIGCVANRPVQLSASTEAPLREASTLSAKRWLCVQHRAGLGPQARFSLRAAGFECHWPRLVERKPRHDDVLRPLFPGYLFVLVEAGQNWGAAHRANYVLGLVGVRENGRPLPLPPGFVEALIARAGAIDLPIDETPETRALMLHARGEKQPLPAGEVRIVGGPCEGLTGLIREDRGEERVRVLLEILGGTREVVVPRNMVEPVQ